MSQLDIEAPDAQLANQIRTAPSSALVDVSTARVRSRSPLTHRPLSLLTFSLPLLVLDVLASIGAATAFYGADQGLMRQVALTVCCLATVGLYRPRFSMSVLDDLPRIAGAVVTAALTEAVLPHLWAGADHHAFGALENAWPIAATVLGLRVAAYALVRYCRRCGLFGARTLVVGAGQVGARLARWARQYPEFGMVPVGFVDVSPPADELGAPYLGEVRHLQAVVAKYDVTAVVVAFGRVRATDLLGVFRTTDELDIDVHLVPRFFELQNRATSRNDRVFGMPLVGLRSRSRRGVARRAKRLLDIVASTLALVASAPVLAGLAIAVRFDGGPGVIFKQERVGRDGRTFTVYKFRSLRPVDEAESQTTWNIEGDDRMSRLGKLIRKTSLDELPQLVNILRGDMSLVGPRPERPHFVDLFKERLDGYDARHRMHTGLTGLAAVHGLRGDTSIEDRVYFDNQYIDNWSPWLDFVVIVRTVAAVLRGSHG